MAFTGSATVKKVTDTLCRITGLSLAQGASGTIQLHGGNSGASVKLPAAFQPAPYTDEDQNLVSLQDAVSVLVTRVGAETVLTPIEIVKTGTTSADFTITVTNNSAGSASTNLEFYVRFK